MWLWVCGCGCGWCVGGGKGEGWQERGGCVRVWVLRVCKVVLFLAVFWEDFTAEGWGRVNRSESQVQKTGAGAGQSELSEVKVG